MVGLEPVGSHDRPGLRALGIGRPGDVEVEGLMARLQGRRLARLDQALARVLAHRLEQAIPIAVAAVLGDHQRLVDQPPQQVGHLALVDAFTGRDLLRALQREASRRRPPGGGRARARRSSTARGSSSAWP